MNSQRLTARVLEGKRLAKRTRLIRKDLEQLYIHPTEIYNRHKYRTADSLQSLCPGLAVKRAQEMKEIQSEEEIQRLLCKEESSLKLKTA